MTPMRFGRYELLEKIGTGGMAEVFTARAGDPLSKVVAIKRIRPRYMADEMFVNMFIEEANLAAKLNHPNIAKILDLGRADDQYYIAMEHVHGRDLKAVFSRSQETCGPVPIAQACHIAMKMCEALEYAHQRRDHIGRQLRLVHRDVSLHNVLVSFDGAVKLIDFGVAKATSRAANTQEGSVKGKLAYMSPEQMRGLPVDQRSDIFATGVVLYELLTGRRLFFSESVQQTIARIRSGVIVPPRTYNQRIPTALEAIVLEALAKHSHDRFQSASTLRLALHDFACRHQQLCTPADVASWLRGTFAREYPRESVRLTRAAAMTATAEASFEGATMQRPAIRGCKLERTRIGWASAL